MKCRHKLTVMQCSYLPMLDLESVVVLGCKDQNPLERNSFLFVGS